MTKEGYTHIIVPRSLHSQLKTLAQQNSMSISQLINQLINISINVSLNIGINTSINTTSLNKPNPSLMQALNQQNSQKQTAFAKREGMETVGCHRKVGLPGFEPGSFPHEATANTHREPKSPSLDQASRQPHCHISIW
jgi:hypothetical protein